MSADSRTCEHEWREANLEDGSPEVPVLEGRGRFCILSGASLVGFAVEGEK